MLNTSVLTKMPRDYTEPPFTHKGSAKMYSPLRIKRIPSRFSFKLMTSSKDLNATTKTAKGQPKSNSINNSSRLAPIAIGKRMTFPGGDQKKRLTRRLSNSEMIGTIDGDSAFKVSKQIMINPGIEASFPWLSKIAPEFQQYRFHYLRYRYVPRCATTTQGTVIISPEYNPRESPPFTDVQASNTQNAVTDSAWRELGTQLETRSMFPLGPRKLVRTFNTAGDPNVYDVGRLHVCTTGISPAGNIGQLWVDYDVELFVPQTTTFYVSPSTLCWALNETVQTLIHGTSMDLFFPTVYNRELMGITYVIDYALPKFEFTLPPGAYKVTYDGVFSDSVSEANELIVEMKVDDVARNPFTQVTRHAGSAPRMIPMHIEAFVNVASSSVATIRLTAVFYGGAGVLTVVANSSQVIITRV